MPSIIEPQLATLVSAAPGYGDWSYEIKFDGYRMLTRIEHGQARLFTRNGHDWSARLPHLRDVAAEIAVDNAWFDGEATVLDADGKPDFNALQNAFDRHRTQSIILFVFDLLWLNGRDLRDEPLRARRRVLHDMMDSIQTPLLRYSEDFAQDPESLIAAACKMKLEGIIGKRGDSPYRSGRSTDWIKIKCHLRQEFVIGGIARTKGAKAGVRSLLLGVYEPDGGLRYAGHVRPHLTPRQSASFQARIERIQRVRAPFRNPPAPDRDQELLWLKPEVVAEVSFLEWTPTGEIRHASFEGIREDKPPRAVNRESAVASASRKR
ncbi:non-homologous end-joining DNA ligase [Trinickia symbiotica]|nr:non-homologous end-joining DNA ligase [Trinickia symbiotica]